MKSQEIVIYPNPNGRCSSFTPIDENGDVSCLNCQSHHSDKNTVKKLFKSITTVKIECLLNK